jgi:hypothetical protein
LLKSGLLSRSDFICPTAAFETFAIPKWRLSPDAIAIGVPRDESSRRAYKITHCSIQNIVEVEPLDIGKGTKDNGHPPKKDRGR